MDNQIEIIHPAPVKDIELTATVPQEMIGAQQQIILWCEKKIVEGRSESQELFAAVEHAKKNKWKYTTLQNQYSKSVKKVEYYEKIKGALEAGYYIVPNFPIEIFAIRKGLHRRPTGKSTSTSQWNLGSHQQSFQELPAGEGVYRNPFPLVVTEEQKGSDGKTYYSRYPEEWDQFEFPINMAKPQIMSVTQTAMTMKLFDRVGVMPSVRKKKEDPVIIGQIVRKGAGRSEKVVSFMIAWHLNTNVI